MSTQPTSWHLIWLTASSLSTETDKPRSTAPHHHSILAHYQHRASLASLRTSRLSLTTTRARTNRPPRPGLTPCRPLRSGSIDNLLDSAQPCRRALPCPRCRCSPRPCSSISPVSRWTQWQATIPTQPVPRIPPAARRCLRRHSRGRARPSAMVPCQLAPTLPRDRLSLTRAASAPQQLRCRSAHICPNHTAAGQADTPPTRTRPPQRRPFALLLTLPSCACSFGCDVGPRFAPSTLVLRRQPAGPEYGTSFGSQRTHTNGVPHVMPVHSNPAAMAVPDRGQASRVSPLHRPAELVRS